MKGAIGIYSCPTKLKGRQRRCVENVAEVHDTSEFLHHWFIFAPSRLRFEPKWVPKSL